mmetsp:Transcript_32351/g.72508  ORF Transcript_32351/g.72508 Transcript_32351/m.72508 type:complete len:198 (-) Transcript_32351:78-671(-)
MYHAPWTVLVFVPYILFTTMAVMNIITGIFVEQTMEAAKQDDEHLLQQQLQFVQEQVVELRDLFSAADIDCSNEITIEEFTAMLEDARTRAFFLRLGMDSHEAVSLFHALDGDGSGGVDFEEFVFGIMRVGAGVKALDMVTLMHDVHVLGGMLQEVTWNVGRLLVLQGEMPDSFIKQARKTGTHNVIPSEWSVGSVK